MPIGTLFSWLTEKGYGFLQPDSGNRERAFVHATEMNRLGIRRPIVGTPFEWELIQRNGKPYAVNVELLKPFGPKVEADTDDSDDE
ncbi:cold shock domain-containing protein [Bradyrhizobium sp. S69]|uniref:cold-shock protein n=1 Tax=Bradyrhizobium sp. S69 TaxID=1641856 RepID=UPI00131B6677|nr:cold shock domain-containing protein [Bradyrhizobium sp. S69]